MAIIWITYRVLGEGCDIETHLPSPVSTVLTLCGFVDVEYETLDATEHPPTCLTCMAAAREIRNMRLPDGKVPK